MVLNTWRISREHQIQPLCLVFFDEREQRWIELEEHDRHRREIQNPINRDGYSRPNHPNGQIYPERRESNPRTEQTELYWPDASPRKDDEIRMELLALWELG